MDKSELSMEEHLEVAARHRKQRELSEATISVSKLVIIASLLTLGIYVGMGMFHG